MMMNTWFKIRLVHGVISFSFATLCAMVGAAAVFVASIYLFNLAYPHDAMNGLGGISIAVPAGAAVWIIVYVRGMSWLHARAWIKQEAARIQAQMGTSRRGY